MNSPTAAIPMRTIGRYALFDEIAAGGMATVHLGRLVGPVGFTRTVAIKRLHSHFAKDPDFSAGFVDEARLAARIHHPNVVPIIDVLAEDSELSLVMDYVEGESLARLLRQAGTADEPIPLSVASAVLCGTLYGLHAAHEALNERGKPMDLVHRDVSPQNVLVGSDGIPRLVDFGVAKATQRLQTTAEGQVKGKLAYMAPEQIRRGDVTRQVDVYAAGVVLWELITGRRLFQSDNPAHLMTKVLEEELPAPSTLRPECTPELDQVVMRALSRDTDLRYATARAMAHDLQLAVSPAPPTEVGDWVQHLAQDALSERRTLRAFVESQEVGEDTARTSPPQPRREDLQTRADRRPTTTPGLGSALPRETSGRPTTVTGVSNTAVPERTRLLLPLVFGLSLVGTGIVLLLIFTPRTFDPSTQQAVSVTTPSATHGSLPATPKSEPHDIPVAAAPTSDQDPSSENAWANEPPRTAGEEPPLLPELDPDQARANSAPRATNWEAPRTPKLVAPKPDPCPKFYEDEQGIRRVNRKCWK